MKIVLGKVNKGVGATQYNKLVYALERQNFDFKREAKVKRNGDDYFITVKNLKFKFNCVGELVGIVTFEVTA